MTCFRNDRLADLYFDGLTLASLENSSAQWTIFQKEGEVVIREGC